MRVLLTSHGSIGDIYPMIAYGKALKDAGHSVSFASAPLYKKELLRAGLNYVQLPPDWEQEKFTEFMRKLDRVKNPILQLKTIYKGAVPFLSELLDRIDEALEDHDVLVSSYLFPNYKVIAEKQGKPFASFAFCHNTIPSPDYPPELVPPLSVFPRSIQARWNMLCWRIANVVVDRAINSVIGKVLREKELPLAKDFLTHPCDLVLTAVSKALMSGRGEMDDIFKFTGFLRWQSKESEEEEIRITTFRQDERIPVLTFGSVAFDDTQAIMNRFEKNWPKGIKVIVQTGWSGLSLEVDRPDILIVGKMSHDQLFRHASCVIHHGGAGTTASVLSSGRPHIIIPHIADQNFWGAEMERLGVGLVLKKRRWPENVHSRVQMLAENSQFRDRAIEVQSIMEAEDSAGSSVKTLETFVSHYASPSQSEAMTEAV
ncbi:MAG: glycosyltransferase [Opitutales bacterium]|nr:glycosyltransferase [Opitutales bacterium]